MKTTLELPDALVRELELRAAHTGQELTEAVAELLWKGLATTSEAPDALPGAMVKPHPKSGLPYIECAHAASPGMEVTAARVADLLLEQETNWQHEAGR